MPLYSITVKRTVFSNGIRLEAGMSVEVPTRMPVNPVFSNGGADVIQAFWRIYGIDISPIWGTVKTALSVVQIA